MTKASTYILFPGKAFKARADKHESFIDMVNLSANISNSKKTNTVKATADHQLSLNRY